MFFIKNQLIAEIPCYVVQASTSNIKANLVLYHGWGSSRERQLFRAKICAAFGYQVIVPEIPAHGCRQCEMQTNSVKEFLRVLSEAIEEERALIKNLSQDGKPVVLLGHSLGGLISLGMSGQEHDYLKGIVAMNSTLDWSLDAERLRRIFPEMSFEEIETALEDCHSLLLKAKDYAPEQIKTSVYLLNGALDQTIPVSYNLSLLQLKPCELVRQEIFPDTGHVVTDAMLHEAIDYYNELIDRELSEDH